MTNDLPRQRLDQVRRAEVDWFRWHPEARLWDGYFDLEFGAPLNNGGGVILPRPGGRALALALSHPTQPFRIGGIGELEAGQGAFETLTSGSSGAPRRIVRTMGSWSASFSVNAVGFNLGPGTRVAVLGELEQSLALYGALEGLHLGSFVHLLGGMRPDRQSKALTARAIDVLYATPAQLRAVVDAGGIGHVRLVVVGGSKLDEGLRAALAAAEVREFYGAAETSFITLSQAHSAAASVGEAYPCVEIDIRNGEVWVRSPYLFDRYAGQNKGDARWDKDWLSVGEMGHLVGGSLYLSGRAGRMVTVADQNVFPEEIEAFLRAQPGVDQAAVLPRPDARRGVHLVAVLLGDPSCEPAILAACRARLGALKAPKSVSWRSDWPMLAAGKTDLRTLAEELGP